MDSTAKTRERAIAGVTRGLIGLDQSVTWEGRHFGFMLRHTSKIVSYEAPTFFCDVMTAGVFKRFRHEHHFTEVAGETVMRDVLQFAAPFGLLGTLVERLVLRDYFEKFIRERNAVVKQIAEFKEWERYL
jgi:ligand-binding SRPBCC domain-containing protein